MGAKDYEIIDHTADIGVRVKGDNLEDLFIKTAAAMFDVMVTSKPNLIPSINVPIEVKANSTDELLVKWLQELLYIFDTRHLVLSKFFIDDISENSLAGGALGLKFDKTRHEFKRQIKAVTYHMISVEKQRDGWHAQVIFDI
jgi:SHS2 domain-containing protein